MAARRHREGEGGRDGQRGVTLISQEVTPKVVVQVVFEGRSRHKYLPTAGRSEKGVGKGLRGQDERDYGQCSACLAAWTQNNGK